MSEDESVTRWIERLKAGSETATAQVWNHFYARLVALARRKLGTAPRRVANEEDVVLSAFNTFFRRTRDGRFPRLRDGDDLWQLLVKITERKAFNEVRRQLRMKRGGGKVRGESVFLDTRASISKGGIDQVPGAEPTAEFAAVVAEGLRHLLDRLADEELRQIAVLKLEGCTNQEISDRINRSLPTVERRLRLIRDTWREEPA